MPKFLKIDIPLFDSIISDLFPTVQRPESQRDVLVNSLILSCKEEGSFVCCNL